MSAADSMFPIVFKRFSGSCQTAREIWQMFPLGSTPNESSEHDDRHLASLASDALENHRKRFPHDYLPFGRARSFRRDGRSRSQDDVPGPLAERARDLIRQICAAREVVIVRGSVSPDHIHLLPAAPPVLAPAKLAQYIKGRSSRHLQAEFPDLRKQYRGQHMWARGYFWLAPG